MDAAPPVRRRPFALRFEAAVSFFLAAVLLIGGTVALYSMIGGARYQFDYESAPPCPSVSEAVSGVDCRFSGTAKFISVDYANNVQLQLAGASAQIFTGRLPIEADVQYQPGQTIRVELWRGLVTKVDDAATTANPEVNDNWATVATIGAFFVLVGLGLLIWGVRKWRRRDEDPDGQTMAPLAVSDALFHGQ